MISSIFFQEVPMKRQILMFAAALSLSASCLVLERFPPITRPVFPVLLLPVSWRSRRPWGFCGCALLQSTGLSAIKPIIRLFLLWARP